MFHADLILKSTCMHTIIASLSQTLTQEKHRCKSFTINEGVLGLPSLFLLVQPVLFLLKHVISCKKRVLYSLAHQTKVI